LCIAYSGRCLLSGYFNHRDPNQGTCTNSCRWEYKTHATSEDAENNLHLAEMEAPKESPILLPEGALDISNAMSVGNCGEQERHPMADKTYFLEEKNRPGELMPVTEDEHGTYIMNSKDLRAVEHVKRLTEIGVDCLKIEGRTKSHYYAAHTAQVYRMAIDDAAAGREFNPKYLGILENLANRGYTDGFFERHHTHEYQSYMQNSSQSHKQKFVAEMISSDTQAGTIDVEVKNRFAVGDRLELVLPNGKNVDFILEGMHNLKDGEAMDVAPGSGYKVRLPIPNVEADIAFLARYS
jgi:putative protease